MTEEEFDQALAEYVEDIVYDWTDDPRHFRDDWATD